MASDLADMVKNLTDRLKTTEDTQKVLAANSDQFFLIVIAIIIFFMQCGFAFLEAGSVRWVWCRVERGVIEIIAMLTIVDLDPQKTYWGLGLNSIPMSNQYIGGAEFQNRHRCWHFKKSTSKVQKVLWQLCVQFLRRNCISNLQAGMSLSRKLFLCQLFGKKPFENCKAGVYNFSIELKIVVNFWAVTLRNMDHNLIDYLRGK